MNKFKVGDKVLVLDKGLAMLRAIMPDAPPNHHGVIHEVWDNGEYLVCFPIGDDPINEHSQVAPYPEAEIRHRLSKEE